MIVLFLSCGVIYLKYYALRIWAGFPGRAGCVCIHWLNWILEDSGKHSGNHEHGHQSETFDLEGKNVILFTETHLKNMFFCSLIKLCIAPFWSSCIIEVEHFTEVAGGGVF